MQAIWECTLLCSKIKTCRGRANSENIKIGLGPDRMVQVMPPSSDGQFWMAVSRTDNVGGYGSSKIPAINTKQCPILLEQRNCILLDNTTLSQVKTLLTCNVNWKRTTGMCFKLCQKISSIPGTFPTPADVARCSVVQLQEAAGLGYRAAWVSE